MTQHPAPVREVSVPRVEWTAEQLVSGLQLVAGLGLLTCSNQVEQHQKTETIKYLRSAVAEGITNYIEAQAARIKELETENERLSAEYHRIGGDYQTVWESRAVLAAELQTLKGKHND